MGSSAIGAEEDSGTLELLLASPISRSRIIIEKSIALITVTLIIANIVFLAVCLSNALFTFGIDLIDVFICTISLSPFGLFFGFFALIGRTATIIGPLSYAIFSSKWDSKIAILSLLILMIIGILLLKFVNVEQGKRMAKN